MEGAQNVEVGPIWNQRHAEEKAAEYVRNHPDYKWTGHWNTTRPGLMSTIQVRRRNTQQTAARTENVEVGPIRNQQHAEQKAAEYIRNNPEFQWTGHWNTTRPGRMSVIQVQRRNPVPVLITNTSDLSTNVAYDVEVGPIRNHSHAEEIATQYVLNHPGTEWTGQWKTTIPGTMSVIGIRRSRRTEPDIEVQDFVWIPQTNSETALRNTQPDSAVADNPQFAEPINTERRSPSRNAHSSILNNIEVRQPSAPCAEEKVNPEKHKRERSQYDTYLPTCPICWEAMSPPKRIFQCTNGHLLCEGCRSQPEDQGCPTCRQPIMGRATAMEQLLANLQRRI